MPCVASIPPPDDVRGTTRRQQIDIEIAELEARIIALKAERNELSPISRLHPEVMQEIFLYASQGADYGYTGKTALLTSWICHSWRELALRASAFNIHLSLSSFVSNIGNPQLCIQYTVHCLVLASWHLTESLSTLHNLDNSSKKCQAGLPEGMPSRNVQLDSFWSCPVHGGTPIHFPTMPSIWGHLLLDDSFRSFSRSAIFLQPSSNYI